MKIVNKTKGPWINPIWISQTLVFVSISVSSQCMWLPMCIITVDSRKQYVWLLYASHIAYQVKLSKMNRLIMYWEFQSGRNIRKRQLKSDQRIHFYEFFSMGFWLIFVRPLCWAFELCLFHALYIKSICSFFHSAILI